MMSQYHKSSNPFEDDEEEGANDFVVVDKKSSGQNQASSRSAMTGSSSGAYQRAAPQQNRPHNPNSYSPYSTTSNYSDEDNPFEDKRQNLIRQIENSENTQLESTQRALASLYDSEAMGIATAEELIRQGETLNNIETKTEGMQQNLKTSQRHLNNIKSVFGGIKNWWSSDKKAAAKPAEADANTRLRTTVESIEKTKPDVSGFYNDEDDEINAKFMAGARKTQTTGQYSMISPITRSAREEEVDQNLALMSDGMSRLKNLAMGLGDEIERQNEQLDRINIKVDKTDELLGHQNTQMRKILK
ncbi:synaptosomal-associated protein 29-like [Physella acuta]|uniref:synaptosomal-associated protein 29-like n=1 Tax=Physella acuta TaxID=109671 RepID=UPI0027DAE281|nr:synaptosomal-associated protein 29-like [Physella acuta]